MNYKLTTEADADLLEIFRYTFEHWGEEQAERYLASLEEAFENIASRKAPARVFLREPQQVLVLKCQRHFVFYLLSPSPIIIAILHERMDIITRLRHRLEYSA